MYVSSLSGNAKTAVYIIECKKYKEVYIGSIQAFNTRISLYKSNIKIPENRKLKVSKHLLLNREKNHDQNYTHKHGNNQTQTIHT